MNPLRSVLKVILVLGLMAVLQGCGDSKVDTYPLKPNKAASTRQISNRSLPRHARIGAATGRNGKLGRRWIRYGTKVREIEAQALKRPETARMEKKEAPDVGKNRLARAKAVAEFKAEQTEQTPGQAQCGSRQKRTGTGQDQPTCQAEGRRGYQTQGEC